MPLEWTALASVLKWVGDNFGGEIKKDLTEPAQQAWTAIRWPEKAIAYGQKIQSLYGTLRILGHPRPIPLANVFTDVYIHDRPLALRRTSVEDLEEQFRQGERHALGVKRINGVELVQKTSKLFILGQPGAGKTTFLKHIALQAATGQINKIPIFVSLKELADSAQPLLDFLVTQFAILNLPDSRLYLLGLLESGKAIILFDGLDEITQEQEDKLQLKTAINNFVRHYDKNQVLITCRTAMTDYQFEQFVYVEMADFGADQIATFISKWFSDNPIKGKDCFVELQKPDHRGLYELAHSPLLISLLCLNYEETLRFPDRRVELYEEAIDALLKKWDTSRNIKRDVVYRQLSLGRKRQLFARIATITFEQGKYFVSKAEMVHHILGYLKTIPEVDALDETEGEAVLRSIEAQHGIIVERARGIYSFAHLTFHEYFTAKYIAESGLMSWKPLMRFITQNEWQEIFLLTASLLYDASSFLDIVSNSVNTLILGDEQILDMLIQIASKVDMRSLDEQQHAAARCHLIYSDLFQTYSLLQTRLIDTEHHSACKKALNSAFLLGQRLDIKFNTYQYENMDVEQALNLDRALSKLLELLLDLLRTHQRESELDTTKEILGDLYKKLGFDHDFNDELVQARNQYLKLFQDFIAYLDVAKKLSYEGGVVDLHERFAKLAVPNSTASLGEWYTFHDSFQGLVSAYQQLGQSWYFSTEQFSQLGHYLSANLLLIDCLGFSAINNRQNIMGKLLLPLNLS